MQYNAGCSPDAHIKPHQNPQQKLKCSCSNLKLDYLSEYMQNTMQKAHKRAQMAMQERTNNQQERNAMCETMHNIMQDTSKKQTTKKKQL